MSKTFIKNTRTTDQFWSLKDHNLYMKIVAVERVHNGELCWANVVNMSTGRVKWMNPEEEVETIYELNEVRF